MQSDGPIITSEKPPETLFHVEPPLNRRELFAAMIFSKMIVDKSFIEACGKSKNIVAEVACEAADALLLELAKGK